MAIEKIKISELTPTNTKGLVIVTVYEGGVPKTYSYDLNNITGVVKGSEFAGFVPCSSYIGAYIKPFTSQGGIFDTTGQFFYILTGAGNAGFWDDNDHPQTFTQLNTQTTIVYWDGSQYNSVVIADNSITNLTETLTPQFVTAGFSVRGVEQKHKFDMSRYPICVRTWQEFVDTMQNGNEYINIYVCNDITADNTDQTQIDIYKYTKAISTSGCDIKDIYNLVLSSLNRTKSLRIDVNNKITLKSTYNPITLTGDKGSITFNIDQQTTMNVNGEVSSSFVALTNNQASAVKIVGDIVEWYSGGVVPTDITGNITISGAFTEKADKVKGATNGDIAGLDAKGNLTDSGIAASNVIQKVSGATNGNFAGLDANGNLTDSGNKASDFKTVQTAVSDPTASGTTLTVIDSISQNTDGIITATKKTIQDSSTSQSGVVQLSNSYNGVSENLAVTEKALSDGLSTKQPYGNYKTTQSEVPSPTASGSAKSFIDSISQDTNGVITVTKKTLLNALMGSGYGTCSTAAATTEKSVVLDNYEKELGGLIVVRFDNAVPASATLNINSKGAYPIYYNGSPITANIIKSGDSALLMYSPIGYTLITTDRLVRESVVGLSISGTTITITKADGSTSTITTQDTKNTAGSTDSSSKLYLVGATSQAANPQTYSDDEVYTTSGVLTTKSVQVGGGAATIQWNSNNKAIDFNFI